MRQKKTKSFRSILGKLTVVFCVVTACALVGYFSFFRSYTYQTSLERYEEQLTPLREALVNNIDYYVSTCVKASRSIYYNSSALRLLEYTSGNFTNSETKDSQELFAYMLSVYASIPSATQIHLAAYCLDRSFLVTTEDLVRYMSIVHSDAFMSSDLQSAFKQVDQAIWVESSHRVGNYGHFVSGTANRSQFVFTVHTYIFNLPDSTNAIGLLSVDISTDYIDDNCSFAREEGAKVFIADADGSIVYSADSSLIGQPLAGAGTETWLREDATALGSYTQGGNLVTAKHFNSRYCPWTLYIVTPLNYINRDARTSQLVLMGVFTLYLVILSVLLFFILVRYIHPLKRIGTFIRANIYKGKINLKPRLADYIAYTANDEVGVLIDSIDAMLDTMNDSVVRQYRMRLANRTSELRTLQAQINPHFIYNTLQCIASKTLENGDETSYHYLASFGQLLQYAMNVDESTVSLEREVEHVRRYLDLQGFRFEQQIDFQFEGDPSVLRVLVPKMTLQPLVENSVSHGRLFDKPGSSLRLTARLDMKELLIILSDNGVPLDDALAEKLSARIRTLRRDYRHLLDAQVQDGSLETKLLLEWEESASSMPEDHHGSHIGISNVYLRFLLQFGPKCVFTIAANEMAGTTVTIHVPYAEVRFEEALEGGNAG
ncbi:MAG: histidine kinase [Eubacteriales bacterium]|nr:histidine kinase [Eubacteriales bacterium]